jgi:hypothetical protein
MSWTRMGGLDVYIHLFLIFILNGSVWSASLFGLVTCIRRGSRAFICVPAPLVSCRRPPLWSSGQSSGGPGSIPGTTRKKLVWNGVNSASWVQLRSYLIEKCGSCLENREYGCRDPSRWPRGTLYPQKLANTSPTSGGRSVGIVRSRTQTMEFSLVSCRRIFFL